MTSPNLQFVPQWLKKPSTPSASAQPSPPLSAFSNSQSNSHSHSQSQSQSGYNGGRDSSSANIGGGGGGGGGGAGYPFPNGTGGGGAYVNGYNGSGHTNGLNGTNPNALIDGYANPSSNLPSSHITTTATQTSPSHPSRPFRYTKSQMLSLYDPEKVQRRPLELVDLMESGGQGAGVILSERAGGPMGLMDWTEEERKLFANPVRRQPAPHTSLTTVLNSETSQNIPPNNASPGLRGLSHRAGLSSTSGIPLSSASLAAGGGAGGAGVIGNISGGRGFGRGEGGAFGFGIGGGGVGAGAIGAPGARGASVEDNQRERRTYGGETGTQSGEGKTSGWTAGAGLLGGLNGSGGLGSVEGKGYRGPGGVAFEGAVAKGAKDSPRSSNTASTWRPAAMRNAPSTNPGSGFDGVLGFASPTAKSAQVTEEQDTSYGWRERERARQDSLNPTTPSTPTSNPALSIGGEKPQLGAGGGPGWGKGGRWRMAAAEREKGLEAPRSPEQEMKRPGPVPYADQSDSVIRPTESMAVIPPATPVQERDMQVKNVDSSLNTPTRSSPSPIKAQQAASQPAYDVNTVKWFYTDPAGQQQGPFKASEMQDWYSHGFFQDNLPLRRESETGYQTLLTLKEGTGSAEKPFLTAPMVVVEPAQLPTPPPSSLQPHAPKDTAAPPSQDRPDASSALQGVLEKLQLGSGVESNPVSPAQSAPAIHSIDGPFNGSPRHADVFGGPGPHQSPVPMQNGVRAPWDNGLLAHTGIPPQPFNAWGIAPGQMSPASAMAFPNNAPRSIFESVPPPAPPTMHRAGSGYGPIPMPLSPWGQPQNHIAPPYVQQPGFPPIPMYAPMPPQQYQQQAPMQHMGMQPWQQPPPAGGYIAPEQLQSMPISYPTEAAQPVADNNVHAPPAQQGEVSAKTPVPASAALVEEATTPVQPETVLAPATSSAPEPVVPETPVPSVEASAPAAKAPESAPVPAKPVKASKPQPEESAASPVAAAKSATQPKGRTVSAAIKEEKKEQAKENALLAAAPRPETPTKLAAWAAKEDSKPKSAPGPSLREIQEAEAKVAEAKKVAEVRSRAASAAPSTSAASSEIDLTQTISWGLATSKSANAIAATQPTPAPAWGSSETAPKKTLKQIQEEEQKRTAAAAQAKAAASPAATSAARGYAALAAGTAASSAPAAGWSTVGAGGKAVAPASAVAAAKPKAAVGAAPAVKPIPIVTKAAVKTISLEEAPPSIEFIRWTKQALTGLKNVNMDEFVQMLFTFPVEPGASARADVLEIISDSVYANSSTLDGKRFAQEFYTKRKADAQARISASASGKAPAKATSLADIVKTQPKAANEFGGFKVVKPKGKGKK